MKALFLSLVATSVFQPAAFAAVSCTLNGQSYTLTRDDYAALSRSKSGLTQDAVETDTEKQEKVCVTRAFLSQVLDQGAEFPADQVPFYSPQYLTSGEIAKL